VRLPAAAVQFVLAHPAVKTACLGARTAAEVERNATLFNVEIPTELWADLKAEGLLRADAPVPAAP
jgi:D-threo-aldose 1-dehydrogenase